MKIYISGQITGKDLGTAKEEFERAAEQIRAAGHEPVNPFDNGLPDEASWSAHMVRDVEMLLMCDGIYRVKHWQGCKDARIETHIANELDMHIIEQPHFPTF